MIAAFLDANALYPATLRSVLMELARNKAFRVLWSEQVHQEWMEALKRQRPHIPPGRIERMRHLMEAYVEDATISGYEPLIGGSRFLIRTTGMCSPPRSMAEPMSS